MSILFYKKPEFVQPAQCLSRENCQKYVARAAHSRAAIPSELSFDNVVNGKTVPPCTLQDFLDYLIYVAHDAENLQFYLWLRDYTKRFNALSPGVKALSPPWTETGVQSSRDSTHDKDLEAMPGAIVLSDLEMSTPTDDLSFGDTKMLVMKGLSRYSADNFSLPPPIHEATKARQPYRSEVDQIAAHYLRTGSPRELNLSYQDRRNVLAALERTTHPSAFAGLQKLTEQTLRYQSHRNFIRWSICNGNRPRVFVLRSIAWIVLANALALALALILSHHSRWLRLTIIPVLYFGCVNLIAARQGLCVLLHRRRTRELRPWEMEGPAEQTSRASSLESGRVSFREKLAAFGPTNEFKSETWVRRWESRSSWQKIRIEKVKVGPGGLRIIQDRIIWQAEAWGLLITVVLATILTALPVAGLY